MIKGIVFDLDGTLWQTGASYIYAYHKLCDLYGVTQRLPDDRIRDCLGVKIDQVLRMLFPGVEDQRQLAYHALTFSVEYLLAHPDDCCFEGVGEVLARLSGQYRLYIVSNCLRPYADTFVRISQTEDAIAGIYTIEDGEKHENLRRIAQSLDGKLLFVGDSTDDYDAISDRYTQYFCYARYGYKPCVRYDYAIDALRQLPEVVRSIAIKERQTGSKPYRVFSHGDNQITLMHRDDATAYFGYVRYADENFDLVVKELMAACDRKLIGPIDSNTFYPYRFATDSFDWKLYPDCGGEQELPIFLQNGFRIHQEYISVLAKHSSAIWKKTQKARLTEDYRVEEYYGDAVYDHLEEIYQVASDAFTEAYSYEPISCRDFVDIYVEGLRGVVPDLVMIYRQDAPIAFCFCYEDPEKRFYVSKTVAVKKAERSTAVVMKLVDHAHRMMEKRGHTDVLYHFQNIKLKRNFALVPNVFIKQKKYALLEYEHDT